MSISIWHIPLLSFLASFILTLFFRRIGPRLGLIDRPGALKLQEIPVPSGGGAAMFLGSFLTVLLVEMSGLGDQGFLLASLTFTGFVPFLAGLLDDFGKWPARITPRIVAEIAAAILLTVLGIRITDGGGSLIGIEIALLALIVTTCCNAINLADGLDGLAGGLCLIASIGFFMIAGREANIPAAVVSLILFGSTLGFLPCNFPKATVFMGNSGSHFLGYLVALDIIFLLEGRPAILLFILLASIIGLPLFDMAYAVARRLSSRRPVLQGDRGHLYDGLIRRGLSPTRTVLLSCAIQGLLTLLALISYYHFL